MATTVSWLDLIPGARAGVNYLMGQVANFQRLPGKLTQVETAAVSAKRAAESRGNLAVATQLALVMQGVSSARDSYMGLQGKLGDVLEGLRTAGALGDTTTDLAVLTANTAAGMASLFATVNGLESGVYQLASKVMTAQEVAALRVADVGGTSPVTTLGNYGKYALILASVYAAILIARTRRRT